MKGQPLCEGMESDKKFCRERAAATCHTCKEAYCKKHLAPYKHNCYQALKAEGATK